MLAAADALFADTAWPESVTMDAIAAAAGVGKGTLFRAFGGRDRLLDALWTTKLAAVRAAVEGSDPPLGERAQPCERAEAFMDALLTFKLENRHLLRAREMAPQILQSHHYKWTHGLLQSLVQAAAPGTTADGSEYLAHILLATLQIDLVEELLAKGFSLAAIRRAQAAHVRTVLGDGRG